MKRAIKQLYQKKVSELTVEEFVSTIQYAVSGNTKESLPVIPKEIACVDENFYRMMQEHPEKYIIGMKALSMLLGCSIRRCHFYLRTETDIQQRVSHECLFRPRNVPEG